MSSYNLLVGDYVRVTADRPAVSGRGTDEGAVNPPHRLGTSPGQTPTARRASYRAAGFTKPAAALLVGDYLRIHRDRWPECDQDVDEGFARVEHLRLLDPEPAQQLFAAPAWGSTVVVASLYGLPGVLVLRGEDAVDIQALPNPERAAWEPRNRGRAEPSMVFTGSHTPTDAERQAAEAIDAACRPQADEADWYPRRFSDPFQRRLALESRYGLRTVPLDQPACHAATTNPIDTTRLNST